MTLVTSILAPAVAGMALALEPAQTPWPTPADLAGLSTPAAAHESFAATVRGGEFSLLPKVGDLGAGGTVPTAPTRDESGFESDALSETLRWMLAFAGLAAIGAVRNPRQ